MTIFITKSGLLITLAPCRKSVLKEVIKYGSAPGVLIFKTEP